MKIVLLLNEFESNIGRKFPYSELINNGIMVAGGAVRDWIMNIEPRDIDLFLQRGTFLISNVRIGDFNGKKVHPVAKSFGTVEELLDTFDFTINQLAVFMKDGELWIAMGDRTAYDIRTRGLVYANKGDGTHPVFHVKRIGKFVARGFDIEVDEIITMCERVVAEKDSDKLDYDACDELGDF